MFKQRTALASLSKAFHVSDRISGAGRIVGEMNESQNGVRDSFARCVSNHISGTHGSLRQCAKTTPLIHSYKLSICAGSSMILHNSRQGCFPV